MLPTLLMLLEWSASAAAAPSVPLYSTSDARLSTGISGDARVVSRFPADSVRMMGSVPDQHRAQ